ncbi:LLM class flavin-dependent oxidoreductase [Nakamurella alba]|uniref:LLM class flavin-dependent oxidoreductase n=1 Tax=Nakamurella alba TaxID=2665158 RepID=UPI0018A98F38|nr:LLM class flavin-dependent oxidoreductase [Nakamurella alba]
MTVQWPEGYRLETLAWTSPEASGLRDAMDAELRPRYADLIRDAAAAPAPVDPTQILFTLVVLAGAEPVATTSLKWTDGFAEIKRVYVAADHRRAGLAWRLLAEAGDRARALGIAELVLQTGFRQPEAMALYERSGWRAVPPFGPYEADTVVSRCYALRLDPLLIGVAVRAAGTDTATASAVTGLVQGWDRAGLDLAVLDDDSVADIARPAQLDAGLVASYLALRTRRVAILPVLETLHTEPFHLAKAVQTLDIVSGGRAGWQIGVATSAEQAALVGRRTAPQRPAAVAEAADVVEVARRLWDSWEDDAEIRDAATYRFVDREKLHHIDFSGDHFAVRGPSIVPRSPQGRPPVLTDDPALAATADIVRVRDLDTLATVRKVAPLTRVLWDLPAVGADRRSVPAGVDGIVLTGADGRALRPDDHQGIATVDRLLADAARHPVDGASLRDRLGLERPASRYAAPDRPAVTA